MTRTIMCRKYKEELPALERAPFPGAKGQDIYDNVSAKAWGDWQKHQTLLINEKRLSLIDPATRVFLDEQREKFFRGEQVEQAEGWKPE